MARYEGRLVQSRIIISFFLPIFYYDNVSALTCYSVALNPMVKRSSIHRLDSTLLPHSLRRCRASNSLTVLTLNHKDDKESRGDQWMLQNRETIALLSTRKLLSALDQFEIRYAPSSSRSDLEEAYFQFIQSRNYRAHSDTSNPASESHRNNSYDNFVGNSEIVQSYIVDGNNVKQYIDTRVVEERLQKRIQRRQLQKRKSGGRTSYASKIISKVLHSAPQIVDYTKRKSRRLQKQVADFFLFDDETGVRDVVRYNVRRDPIQIVSPQQDLIVISKNEPLIITQVYDVSLSKNQRSMPNLVREKREFEEVYRDSLNTPDIREYQDEEVLFNIAKTNVDNKSRSLYQKNGVSHDMISRLTSGSSTEIHDSSVSESSTWNSNSKTAKKVYNPYGTGTGSSMESNKDVLDNVSEFLINTTDRFFDCILNTNNAASSNSPQEKHDKVSRSSSKKKSKYRRYIGDHSKHWKDRLEERLDSMLGLHESNEFYRSWTERYQHDLEVEKKSDGKFDAFAVAQGHRKPRQRVPDGKIHDRPFWEVEGSIFSILFGRQQNNGMPRLDQYRFLPWEKGSILSMVRFAFQNFAVVASYLCRWASTQGALPQPIVVLGVSSAILCARPHQRIRAAGIALLLLRIIGEVLHGYMYGNSGWDDRDDFEEEEHDFDTNQHDDK